MSQYFEWLKSVKTSIFAPAGTDFLRSLPDSLLFGTSVFALFTQSFPLGMLVFAMVEFTIAQRLFGAAIHAVNPTTQTPPTNLMCKPGIPSPYQISLVGNLISEVSVPSGPLFFVTAVISYCIGALMNFADELNELGKKEAQWKTRIPLGVTFGSLVLATFMIWRYSLGCESVLNILGSTFLGLFVGMGVLLIHIYLFGRFAINFLGIPLLIDRVSESRPLYVCAKNSPSG